MENYVKVNEKAIDSWVEGGWEWGVPISAKTAADARDGHWDVVLTPKKPVPHDWFLPFLANDRLDGVKVLGLASGGGQQMPIFALLGAECTVFDNSPKQLENEKIVAEREKYQINIIKGDMTQRLPFEDESFDVIVCILGLKPSPLGETFRSTS